MLDNLYFYKLLNVCVVDGDTIKADIDLGFGVVLKKRTIRLAGINAPETTKTIKGTPNIKLTEGIKSKEYLGSILLALSSTIFFKSLEKHDNFGRCLGIIYFLDEKNVITNLNELLLNQGYSERYKSK